MSDDSLRPIRAAEQAADTVRRKARNLLPWLNHHECSECGRRCRPDTQYVREQCMAMPVWQCPGDECGARYYRESGGAVSFDVWR